MTDHDLANTLRSYASSRREDPLRIAADTLDSGTWLPSMLRQAADVLDALDHADTSRLVDVLYQKASRRTE